MCRGLEDRFVAGYVLYTGQETLPFGEKIRALPVEAPLGEQKPAHRGVALPRLVGRSG